MEDPLAFTLALHKRGQVPVPRLLLDYLEALHVDYGVLGRLVVLLGEVGDPFPDGEYRVPASHPAYAEVKMHLSVLSEHDLVRCEEAEGEVRFSFAPLFSRLRAFWLTDMESRRRLGAAGGEGSWPAQVPEFGAVVRYAEQRLGRPLTPTEVGAMLDWRDTYGFDTGVIRRVIDEAVDRDKRRWSYMDAVARRWHEAGVRSVNDLDELQAQHRQQVAHVQEIKNYLRIDRPLTVPEQQLLEKWTREWGFSLDVILKACEATVNVRQPTLRYVDAVLASWRQKGISTVEEAGVEMRQKPTPPPRERRLAPNFQLSVKPRDKSFYEQLIDKPRE